MQGEKSPVVGIVMGSESDWPTMREAAVCLDEFEVAYEARVVSAHRTPDAMRDYAMQAEERNLRLIIAGAGGAAHLPGMLAAWTTVPVVGVPVESRVLKGIDSLLSIVQMPGGVPVPTLAIGPSGSKNAALFAVRMLAVDSADLRQRLKEFHEAQAQRASAAVLTV
jgi:5-(carboxyamino)imidazole ribonucleotide mutase